jgi:dTDP-4-amino-4,6-dideoxygalactose transaminase
LLDIIQNETERLKLFLEGAATGTETNEDEIEAAVGIGNIGIFQHILEKRRRNLFYLIKAFEHFAPYLITIREEAGEKIGPHAFSVIVREKAGFSKDDMVSYLDQAGIDSRNLFYSMPTQCPSYAFLGHRLGDFPEAEYCGDHGFHFGIHQDIEIDQLDFVVEHVGKFLRARGVHL